MQVYNFGVNKICEMELDDICEMFKKYNLITANNIVAKNICIWISKTFNVGYTIDFNGVNSGEKYAFFIADKNNELINFKQFKQDIINLVMYVKDKNKCNGKFTTIQAMSLFGLLRLFVKFYNKKEFLKKYKGNMQLLEVINNPRF